MTVRPRSALIGGAWAGSFCTYLKVLYNEPVANGRVAELVDFAASQLKI